MISVTKQISDEAINTQVMKTLRLDGLVNKDISVLKLMDDDLSDSKVLPVKLSAKGTFKKSDPVIDSDGFNVLSGYVTKCIERMGQDILGGNIAIPVPDGENRFTGPDCKYCPFAGICAGRGKAADEGAKFKTDDDNDGWIGRMRGQISKTDESNT